MHSEKISSDRVLNADANHIHIDRIDNHTGKLFHVVFDGFLQSLSNRVDRYAVLHHDVKVDFSFEVASENPIEEPAAAEESKK